MISRSPAINASTLDNLTGTKISWPKLAETKGMLTRAVSAIKVYPLTSVASPPKGLTTLTLTGDGNPIGVVSRITLELSTTTFKPSKEPKNTRAPVLKLFPLSVTVVPPLTDPVVGETDEMVGLSTTIMM